MNYRPVTFHSYSIFLALFIAIFLYCSPVYALKRPQFYTIQAGSYAGEHGALGLYQNIADSLPEARHSYLRVEKIGSYFTVRAGKFDSREEAEEFFSEAEQYLPNGMILQAYIKEERILKMYQPVSEISLALETEQAALFAEQESSPPAELPSGEPTVAQDLAADAETLVEKPGPDAPASGQDDPGTESVEDVHTAVVDDSQPVAVIDEAQQPKENVEEIPDKGKAAVVEQETEEYKQEAVSDQPAEVTEEDEVEHDATVGQQGLIPEGDVSAPEQAATVPEEIEAEDEIVDDARRFDRLGQPTGFYPVRKVAILKKDIFGGEYKYPTSVYYDPVMDEIYVIGGGGVHPSTRIMVYGPDYYPVASLGEGRGVVAPSGVALDAEGNLYIAHRSGYGKGPSLKVLNPAFFQLAEVFFSDMEEAPENFAPRAVAVDERHIYLAGEFQNGVLVLDRKYNFVRWLVPLKVGGRREQVGDNLAHKDSQRAFDVVVDRNGRVHILCPEQGRIFVLDAEWNFLFAFGMKGGSSGKLSRPRSLAVDVEREAIYVVDYMRHAINIYDYSSGKYLFEVGGMGESVGWFKYPTHVEVDGRGNLIVADLFNHRVQVLLVP